MYLTEKATNCFLPLKLFKRPLTRTYVPSLCKEKQVIKKINWENIASYKEINRLNSQSQTANLHQFKWNWKTYWMSSISFVSKASLILMRDKHVLSLDFSVAVLYHTLKLAHLIFKTKVQIVTICYNQFVQFHHR